MKAILAIEAVVRKASYTHTHDHGSGFSTTSSSSPAIRSPMSQHDVSQAPSIALVMLGEKRSEQDALSAATPGRHNNEPNGH
jgi:hypothetical protein